MYHVYVSTPLQNNSQYAAHLLEHCLLGRRKTPKEYFENEEISGECYTYYTCYTLKSEETLGKFLRLLQEEIPKEVISYETAVLRKETASPKYFKALISKIWQELYGENFRYGVSQRISAEALRNYHETHYRNGTILVVEKDAKPMDIEPAGFTYEKSFHVRLRSEKEFVTIAKYTPESIFVMCLLESLFDSHTEFHERYLGHEYFWNDALQGEFHDRVFISIDEKQLASLLEIEPNFIAEYVDHALASFDNCDFVNIDGPTMLKYGYCLSEGSKKQMITQLGKYYEEYRGHVKNNVS